MLILVQHVADKGAERLHRYVQRCVEYPEHHRRRQQTGGIGHPDQRRCCEQRADKEIGAATTEPAPGPVAIMADDRLNQQAGQGRSDPQQRQIIQAFAQRLEDAAHIGVLKGEADLDAEEAEADIPQSRKTLSGAGYLCAVILPVHPASAP